MINHKKIKIEYKNRIQEKVAEFIGQASMCWEPIPSINIFRTSEAIRIFEELLQFLLDNYIFEDEFNSRKISKNKRKV